MAGTVVTMTGPFVGEDEAKFNATVAEFESWTGIDMQYTGSKEFEGTHDGQRTSHCLSLIHVRS